MESLPKLLVLEPTSDPLKPTHRFYTGKKFEMREMQSFLNRYEHRDYGVAQVSLITSTPNISN